jgi:hypothetical protein
VRVAGAGEQRPPLPSTQEASDSVQARLEGPIRASLNKSVWTNGGGGSDSRKGHSRGMEGLLGNDQHSSARAAAQLHQCFTGLGAYVVME